MINLQYHKGQPCICSSTFCQEGYCSECAIYAMHFSGQTPVAQEAVAANDTPRYEKNSPTVGEYRYA